MVELFACGARGPEFDSRYRRFDISCFQVAIWPKYRLSDVNPQNNQPTNYHNKDLLLGIHAIDSYGSLSFRAIFYRGDGLTTAKAWWTTAEIEPAIIRSQVPRAVQSVTAFDAIWPCRVRKGFISWFYVRHEPSSSTHRRDTVSKPALAWTTSESPHRNPPPPSPTPGPPSRGGHHRINQICPPREDFYTTYIWQI